MPRRRGRLATTSAALLLAWTAQAGSAGEVSSWQPAAMAGKQAFEERRFAVPRLTRYLNGQAETAALLGRYAKAEDLRRESLRLVRASGHRADMDLAVGENELSWVLSAQGKLGEAEAAAAEARGRFAAMPPRAERSLRDIVSAVTGATTDTATRTLRLVETQW